MTARSWRIGTPLKRRQQRIEFGGTGAIAIDAGIGLLEGDAGGHRERTIAAEASAQEAAQNHDPFVMRRAGHPGFAFDIDHARLSHRDRSGDPRRPSEAVAADVKHGESVDLPDRAAIEMNDQRAFRDQAADLFLDKVEPQHPFALRAFDMRTP